MKETLLVIVLVALLASGCSQKTTESASTAPTPVATESEQLQPDAGQPNLGSPASKSNKSSGALNLEGVVDRRRQVETPESETSNEPVSAGLPAQDLPQELVDAANGKRIVTIESNGQIIDQTEDGIVLRVRTKE